MKDDENAPTTNAHRKSTFISKSVLWKLFILTLLGCLNYFYKGLHSYVVNEWTQHIIKRKYFGNRTFSANFSACETTNKSDPDYITYTHVQQETARWQIYNTIASTVPAFITAVVYPSYSDTFGRKYLFILSLTGIFLQLFIDALTILFNGSLAFIVLGAFMFGISGTSYCLLAALFTSVADVTESGKQRTAAFMIVESLLVLLWTISGLVAGFFIDATGFTYPGISCACLSLANLLIAVFLLPEALPQSLRQKRLPVHKSLKRVVDFYLSSDFKGQRSLYILLIVSYVVVDFCGVHRRALETLYQLGMPFCWGPKKIGYFAAITNVGQSSFSIGIVTLLQKYLSDVSIGMLASLSNACSFVLEGFAYTEVMLYLVAVPVLFANMTTSMIRGLLSAMTSPEQQGALSASICLIQNIVWLIATFGHNLIYSATVGFMSGFVFLVLAGFAILGVALLGLTLLAPALLAGDHRWPRTSGDRFCSAQVLQSTQAKSRQENQELNLTTE